MEHEARRPAAPDLRAAAVRVVERTLASRSSAEGLLARAAAPFDERDRRLLAELVYGTLRWKLRLENVVERASSRPMARIDPRLRAVLLVGACQLLTLDRIPAHAAVDAAAGEARRRGGGRAAGFVNAVLRRLAASGGFAAWPVEAEDPVWRLAIEQSHPPELVARWIDRFGFAAAGRMLAAGNGPRAPHALAFADRGGREALRNALAEEGIASTPGALAPGALVLGSPEALTSRAFARGDFYIQDEASQAAALVPPPRPGERVLDAAAAPGGKGLAILAAEPSARVLLADLAPRRLALLRHNLVRLGRALPVAAADAARPPWRPASFDRVVLDAPCSGTGTLRRHPELRWRFRASELTRLADAALAMLFALAPAVRAGGLLIHVTCSVEAEENEEVARRFVAASGDFVAEPLAGDAPWITAGRQEAGRWRVLPGDGHDGFSVAVWRRRK